MNEVERDAVDQKPRIERFGYGYKRGNSGGYDTQCAAKSFRESTGSELKLGALKMLKSRCRKSAAAGSSDHPRASDHGGSVHFPRNRVRGQQAALSRHAERAARASACSFWELSRGGCERGKNRVL